MSANAQVFSEDQLKLEVLESSSEITVTWVGKSVQRNPNHFIIPVLTDTLKKAASDGKAVVWDFRHLEYMNSSTITPVIKTLEIAKKSSGSVRLLYNKAKRWQDLSFAALRIFETKDGRIQVTGD